MLQGPIQRQKRRFVLFSDNNIGGNPAHLRELCAALEKTDVLWGAAVTYNIMSDPDLVSMMSRSGCRAAFVGLESFNPATIQDMNKKQNRPHDVRRVVDQNRKAGILMLSGLLVSATMDDCRYIDRIPQRLKECGLQVPAFISFECPIPGTPYFHRLAVQDMPAFLPNALLRDFNGYALTVRPQREPLDRFVDSYVNAVERVYSASTRFAKFVADSLAFLCNGFVVPMIANGIHMASVPHRPHPDRTYLTGSDVAPLAASNIPFEPSDFRSLEEIKAVLEPMRVTDAEGHVLPEWRNSISVFKAKGKLSADAQTRAQSTAYAMNV